MRQGFDSEPIYNKKCLRAKIKSYDSKINTKFHDNGMPEEGPHCLSLILIHSVFKMGENYYPQKKD